MNILKKKTLSSDIDVVLGVRSEDLQDNLDQFKGLSNKMSIKDSFLEKIQCKVILMENLGSSIVVHCKIGDSIIRMNAFKTFQLKTDEELSIRINMMKVYFFERDTGEII